MTVLVYFEIANNPEGERDHNGLVMYGGGSCAELVAAFESESEYDASYPDLVKRAKAEGWDMITESIIDQGEDPERINDALAYLNE